MPTLTVSDETYQRITVCANARSLSVDQYLDALSAVDSVTPPPTQPLTGDAWREVMREMEERARERASRYPEGFRVDDSREAMYEGRLAAQM